MTVDDDCSTTDAPSAHPPDPPDGPFRLGRAVASLYSDLRLTPTLHSLLEHSRPLVGGIAGSISVVDHHAGTYSKVAERGILCRLGDTFSLADGATGHAVAHRGPVVIDDYSALTSRHLPPDHPANRGSVVAVPIWWRGDLIGVNVAFAGRRRRFTAAEIDRLDVLTQTAAGAIVTAGSGEPSLARLIRDRGQEPDAGTRAPTTLTEVGRVRPVPATLARAALDLVASAERAAARGEPPSRLHVALVHRSSTLRLLIQHEGAGGAGRDAVDRIDDAERRALHALAAGTGGAADVAHVPGWGTLLRADLPYTDLPPAPITDAAVTDVPLAALAPDHPAGPRVAAVEAAGPTATSPLTARETEVLALVASGLADREIARRLVVSPKTVEKHVGAAIRKTGTRSRTGAAVHALERGWI
ncbi:LuxR C-terminal-related transcriptional regulator [Cellulomonas sp. ATA003]|uniref:LuxR C-terminal-related transcriptional regulator n=1 Tax=Cellulomonas sp. ATA003 TaxID=3073064 RepID=UPI0028736058|nr:LuxR C-terminal-related transcriptional regulator [Cellulomonas sp. ATA003]WNB86575.1 LuxR C-terminal-related transcriptional regulator [Cellulomonas sp. ATA003]